MFSVRTTGVDFVYRWLSVLMKDHKFDIPAKVWDLIWVFFFLEPFFCTNSSA